MALNVDDDEWIQGRVPVAEYRSRRFARPYRILPIAWHADGDSGHLAALYSRGGDEYDARHARVFVEELLPAAPDISVQMAHLWGGARFAPEALGVYADAIEAKLCPGCVARHAVRFPRI